ncbi:Retrovirus-related Pol polyprotein from transposon 412 [Labeo rohita]|uniref:ribonuclease H n=1 Tax=Labeo rohita TaxID=84645 RepID=A0A498NHM0_LABRO|nr:Retrovirus-related Pol polyprotein from transposon 412 [Labeo rohita]
MSSPHKPPLRSLPKGLVGVKCTAQVIIGEKEIDCLLDTGSQVTTVPQSFYETHLSDHPLKPLENLLEVEGANGQAVPYLGYIELALRFPKEFVGVEVDVPTLALVVPDLKGLSQVLIGTNSLDVLYSHYINENESNPCSNLHGYQAVLKVLEARWRQASSEALGHVRLMGNFPEVVPAGNTVVLNGCVQLRKPCMEKWVTLEQPPAPFPSGLLVATCVHTLSSRHPSRLSVLLKNGSQADITIPPKAVLAEIHAVDRVVEKTAQNLNAEALAPTCANLTFDFGDSPLSSDWKERISNLLNSMPEVFSLHDLDYGCTGQVKHQIRLADETPFKHRARPIHPRDIDAVRRHLQELTAAGIIRESESPFSSPIVVVRKKDGSVRLCIDFRKLNSQTIRDAYALPNLEEVFSVLTGSRWFSVLDLKSGFYQIEMEESDKSKTAFVCPLGFWEFNRMPQGITNAPSTFQRLMERCMGDLHRKQVLVFIDDLIVFSKTLEEHELRLVQVLNRLKEYGLKLSPEKCCFFQTSVRYLGHVVSKDGVETDPAKVEALKTWPRPTNLKELRAFLGFARYYRRFVCDYSKIVKPLTGLTEGYPLLRRGRSGKREGCEYFDVKEQFGDRWTVACQEAFDAIISKLTSAPVLGFADPKLPYILHTDASTTGLGAALYQEQDGQMRLTSAPVLGFADPKLPYILHTDASTTGLGAAVYQEQDGQMRVIAFASRGLTKSIHKIRTTPYHPRGNPVERFNRTLLQMLGTLENKQKSRLKEFVKPLVHAYNCTRNDTTGYTPYELMFGRHPRLPVDLAFGLPVEAPVKSHSQYVKDLKDRLRESYEMATRNAAKLAERNKRRFDERVVASPLEEGDRVLVRNVRLRGKHKLADKWEQDVQVVVKKAGDLPVYTVRPVGKSGPLRTLHRDLLFPCGFLQANRHEQQPKQRIIRRPRTRACSCNDEVQESGSGCEYSGSEDDQFLCPVLGDTLDFETRVLVNPDHLSCPETQNILIDSPVIEPVRETIPTESVPTCGLTEGNPEQPVKERSPDCRLVEGSVPEAVDVEIPSAELESGDTNPGFVLSPESLGGSPAQEAEMNVDCEVENRSKEDLALNETMYADQSEQMNDTEFEEGIIPRRSQRERRPAKRLEYSQLGNPLTVVIQSLLQGLNVAFSTSLEETNVASVDDVPVVVAQPQKYADAAGRACVQEGRV